jgi:methylglutaconyl-CoA hydratase
VSDVVALDALEQATEEMVKIILNNGPMAMKAAKQLVFDVNNQVIDSALIRDTSERIASIRVSNEGQEGLTAFFEKRAAKWQVAN